jgi:UDPglucose 6-dehydrogenase
MEIKNICCIGAGYVGGPTMAVIALKCPNINVTVVDANPEKIKAWNGPLNKLPVYEPGLSDVIKEARGRNLFFSENISENIEKAEMIFMAVNTPTKKEGDGAGLAADLRYVKACARDIAKYSKSDKIVIEKSTLPVRTAEKIKEILEAENKEINFEILSNPEFLAEGTAIQDLFKSDRVLIGGDESKSGQNAIKALFDIYANWIPKEKILTTNVWSSELSKLASNAMLAQRISSINSLSALCEETGADINELSKAIGLDHRIGPHFLKASVGFGGSCFQKDILNLVYLCRYYNLNEVAEYWHKVTKINDFQKNRFAQKIIDSLGKLQGKKISILGWAFKANTNDSRESAAIDVSIKLLLNGGFLKIFDPMVTKTQIKIDLKNAFEKLGKDDGELKFLFKNIEITNSINEAINEVDAIGIVTDWDLFKNFNWKSLQGSNIKIFDGRNIIDDYFYSIGKH